MHLFDLLCIEHRACADHGVGHFTRDELQNGFASARWRLRCNRPEDAAKALAGRQVESEAEGEALTFTAAGKPDAALALKAVVASGLDVYEFGRRQVELTELVLQVLQDDNKNSGRAPAAPRK